MQKTITLRMDQPVYETFKRYAESDHRSIANFIETAAWRYVNECSFVSESEMNEIRQNRSLIRRLKTGSTAWRQRKGRWVE